MKILIFNTLYTPNLLGGAERSVQLLAEGLVEEGHQVTVCTTSDKTYSEEINGVSVEYLKVPNLFWGFNIKSYKSYAKLVWHFIDSFNFLASSKIKKFIKRNKPDVIHTNNLAGFSVIVWKLAKKMGIPFVHTLRDYYLTCPKCTRYKNNRVCENTCLDCKILSIPKKIYSKNVPFVIGISKYILDAHIKRGYFLYSKTKVIPNSVKRIELDTERKVKDKIVNFGYLGRISSEKGLDILLEAFSKRQNLNLFIGGVGLKDYVDSLKSKYNANNINFLGRVEPQDFFKKIDCLIVPSSWEEPFGRVVIEALYNWVPVIVSNKGGLPEIVKNKDVGLVFTSDSIDSLLRCIDKYHHNIDFYNLHVDNINHIQKIFDEKSIVNIYGDMYKELYNKE